MELADHVWPLLVIAAVLVGVSKTGLPGVGILSVVLMVWAVGREQANQANGMLLILLLVGDVFAVAWYRRHANWWHLARLLPPAVVGVLVGYVMAELLKQHQMEAELARLIGGIVLAMLVINRWWTWRQANREHGLGVGLKALAPAGAGQSAGMNRSAGPAVAGASVAAVGSLAVSDSRWRLGFAVSIGGLAGITTMLANAAGPLLVIYLLAMRLDKRAFIGTAAWYFLLLNSFKVPFMASLGWITAETLRVNLLLAPVALAGAVLGLLVARYIPQRAFRLVAELLAAAAALKLAVG